MPSKKCPPVPLRSGPGADTGGDFVRVAPPGEFGEKKSKTYPVTSCEAERFFSTMRLFNWLRSTMTTTRLNNLAVCHVLRARLFEIPNSAIKKTFVEAKSRRLDY